MDKFDHCVYLRGYDAEKEEVIGHNSYGDHEREVRVPLENVF